MIGSDFIYDSNQLLYKKYHKVNFRGGGSCIDSPDSMKNKKPTDQKNKKMKNNGCIKLQKN